VDVQRGIFPTIFICDTRGIQEIAKEEVAETYRRVMEARVARGAV
jgi:hypothetical protein